MQKNNLELSKQELIKDLEEKFKNKILEKENMDLLIKLIKNSDNLSEANAIAMLGTTYKQTGLHFDKRLEKWGDTIKFFKKNEKLSFISDKNTITHKLIIGDNYDALLNLLITYRGKIDVIYIDPPYSKDSMGEFADTNYDNSITRDNLLSMLYPRLVLAKQLLSDKGVIFCSIDHRNEAYIKCLFDEIMLENNFIASCFVLDNLKGKSNDGLITNVGHRLLVYAKNVTVLTDFGGFNKIEEVNKKSLEEKYKEKDEKGLYSEIPLNKTGQDKKRENRPTMYFPILTKNGIIYSIKDNEYKKLRNNNEFDDKYIKKLENEYTEKGFNFILPVGENNKKTRWTYGFDGFKKKLKDKDLYYKNSAIYEKKRPSLEESLSNIALGIPKTLLYKSSYSNGTSDLNKTILKNKFSFPKSVSLIIDLLKLTKDKDSIILDFFAGSGTTGEAVMELNRKDNGNRMFILCTNNEITKENPNGIAYDVTSKRLKRIMTGECYDGTNDFKWIGKNKPYNNNLEVVEINKINSKEQSMGKTAFDVVDETLYGLKKFENLYEKIDWICTNFDKTQKYVEGEK